MFVTYVTLETPKVGAILALIIVELGNKRMSHVFLTTYNYSSLEVAVKCTFLR